MSAPEYSRILCVYMRKTILSRTTRTTTTTTTTTTTSLTEIESVSPFYDLLSELRSDAGKNK